MTDNIADKIVVDLGFANLIVEKYTDQFQEVIICLQDKETRDVQDIALVRGAVDMDTGKSTADAVDCFVWGNSDQEDWTDHFTINHYKGDEE